MSFELRFTYKEITAWGGGGTVSAWQRCWTFRGILK